MKFLTHLSALLDPKTMNIPALKADDVLTKGLDIAYFLAGVIAVIVIIIAGLSMITGGNNPANITKAKNAILYAVIGIVVIFAAFTITQYVAGRF